MIVSKYEMSNVRRSGFRAQPQQLLLEIQIEGQGTRKIERKREVSRGQILPGAGHSQQLGVQLDRARGIFRAAAPRFVIDHQNFSLQE